MPSWATRHANPSDDGNAPHWCIHICGPQPTRPTGTQEWYAVQQVTNVEFYSSCTDVRVVNPLGTGAVISGTVSIGVTTGTEHLPAVCIVTEHGHMTNTCARHHILHAYV